MDNLKLTTWEAVSFISIVSLFPLLLALPQLIALKYQTGAIIHSIYISLIILGVFSLILKLFSSFGKKDIFDISKDAGGKYFFYFTGLIFFAYLFLINMITIVEFGHDIKNVLFIHAPLTRVSFLFVVGLFIGSIYGLRALFRVSSIIFPIIIVGLLLILYSVFPKIDLTNITPILGSGVNEIFLYGATKIGRYESLVILFFITPFVNNIKKIGYFSIFSSSFIIILVLFMLFTVIPYPALARHHFPLFVLTKLVGFGRFFQRVESIFTLIWLFSTFIYLAGSTSLCALILNKLFNIKYIKRILPILAILTLSSSLLMQDYNLALQIRDAIYLYISPFLLVVLPLFILLLAKLKMSGGLK